MQCSRLHASPQAPPHTSLFPGTPALSMTPPLEPRPMRLRFPRRLRAARLHPSPSPALGFAPPHAPPCRRGAERAASLPAGPVQSASRLVRLGRPVWTYGKAVRYLGIVIILYLFDFWGITGEALLPPTLRPSDPGRSVRLRHSCLSGRAFCASLKNCVNLAESLCS